MSTKLVIWMSQNCLPCSCKGTVNVILCTIFNQTVPGQIIESSSTSGCESGNWKYQIQYDSDDLPAGVTALATTDIVNVACEGCLTTWIKEREDHAINPNDTEATFDIDGSDPDDIIGTLSITVANPNNLKTLKGMVFYFWRITLTGNNAFESGAGANLYIDGVNQGSVGVGTFKDAAPGGIYFYSFVGGAGSMPLDIPPGETKIVELRFISANTTPPNGTGNVVASPTLSFLGSTTSA